MSSLVCGNKVDFIEVVSNIFITRDWEREGGMRGWLAVGNYS
jgi:hypothetical protein